MDILHRGAARARRGRELLCKATWAKRFSLRDLLFIAKQAEFGKIQIILHCVPESGFAVLHSWKSTLNCQYLGYFQFNTATVTYFDCGCAFIGEKNARSWFLNFLIHSDLPFLWLLVMGWVDLCSWLLRIWNVGVGAELKYLNETVAPKIPHRVFCLLHYLIFFGNSSSNAQDQP